MPLDCIMSCLPRYEEEIISSRIFLAFWHLKKVKVAKINVLLKFLILSNFEKNPKVAKFKSSENLLLFDEIFI